MNEEELIKELKTDFGFWDRTARAFIECKGKCAYCDEDLHSIRIRYASHNIDHIFPVSRFPKLANKQENLVLSCFKCNNLKRNRKLRALDVEDDAHALSGLKDKKWEIVKEIKEELKEEIEREIKLCQDLNKKLPWSQDFEG